MIAAEIIYTTLLSENNSVSKLHLYKGRMTQNVCCAISLSVNSVLHKEHNLYRKSSLFNSRFPTVNKFLENYSMFFRIKSQPWCLRGMLLKIIALLSIVVLMITFRLTCVKGLISRNANVANFGRETIRVNNKSADEKRLIRLLGVKALTVRASRHKCQRKQQDEHTKMKIANHDFLLRSESYRYLVKLQREHKIRQPSTDNVCV